MKIISNKKKLLSFLHNEKNLGFVPTMGAIHLGHMSIVKKSISQCNKTIVSIFVNEPQFNREADFKKYPRVIKKDISIIKKLKVDYLFLPKVNQIYPDGPNKNIKISALGKKLCGKFRPKHFEAVVDVIDRFIKIINPKKIYFGEKDMQQLKIIQEFIKKKNYNIKIIGCKTVREKNGIPYSSRNNLLSNDEREIASRIFYYLYKNKKNLIRNINYSKKIKNYMYDLGVNKIDYVEIIDINKFEDQNKKKKNLRIFIAYYIGSTRLIDNI